MSYSPNATQLSTFILFKEMKLDYNVDGGRLLNQLFIRYFEMMLSKWSLRAYQLIILHQKLYFSYATSSQYHKSEKEIKAEYDILVKAKRNPKFFAPLYEKYYDPIFIFINKRVDNEEATADLTAMVFYKCLQKIEKFECRGLPFSAWLFKIAINEINLFFRAQKSLARSVSLQDKHIDILFEEMECFPGPARNEIVTKLLSSLSSDDVQFLELRFFESRSFKEMGYLLGLTEVNAKIKTYRILKKLKEQASDLNL